MGDPDKDDGHAGGTVVGRRTKARDTEDSSEYDEKENVRDFRAKGLRLRKAKGVMRSRTKSTSICIRTNSTKTRA